jgi:hypothetical protein
MVESTLQTWGNVDTAGFWPRARICHMGGGFNPGKVAGGAVEGGK